MQETDNAIFIALVPWCSYSYYYFNCDFILIVNMNKGRIGVAPFVHVAIHYFVLY